MKNILVIISVIFFYLTVSANQKLPVIKEIKVINPEISLRTIFAVTSDKALVGGTMGSIFITSDQGENFTGLKIHGSDKLDFRDIHYLKTQSREIIIAMSIGTGSNSRIYRSLNNGKDWKMVYKCTYKNGFLNSLSFWNEQTGIAVGDPVKGKLFILTTQDSGKTWNEIDHNYLPKTKKGEAGFAASGTSVATYGNKHAWIGSGGLHARVFKTNNNGQSWKVYNTPFLHTKASTGIFSVYFRNKDLGVIAGGDYTEEQNYKKTISFTQDGGKTWKLPSQGQKIVFQSCIGEIILNNRLFFITTGPSGSYLSEKGDIWKKISASGYHCLSVSPDKKTVWFAGSKGRLGILNLK